MTFYDERARPIPQGALQGRYVIEHASGRQGRIHGWDPQAELPMVLWSNGESELMDPINVRLPVKRIRSVEAGEIGEVLRSAHEYCTECAMILAAGMAERFPEHDWLRLVS